MEISMTVTLLICGALMGAAYQLVRDRLIVRMFPAREARRRTKALMRGKLLDKMYLRNTGRAKVLTAWMENNPENPAAQALRSAEAEASIRTKQEIEDVRKARVAEARRREDMELNWALENPTNDSAKRYLKERLAELKALCVPEESNVKHYEYLLNFYHPDDTERADFQLKLDRAKAELRRLQESIYEIQLSLGVDALDKEQ